ncbi:MAG: extracellular solute-binding protein [Clostridiales bacterium]|jgi:ABC-type glycerol-3-phosphate transport system substrate-binding protein|nr:extracellular solute-binding protein [Clostridiales bacterium]
MGRLIRILIAAVLSAALFLPAGCDGCGGESRPDDVGDIYTENPSELSGSIKVALPSTGDKREIFNNAIDEYKKTRPNVTVTPEWKTSDEFYLSYKTDISSGSNVFPDAALIDHVYVQGLAGLNLIANVTSVTEHYKELYVDNLIEANALDGRYYAFPFSANTVQLYVNDDIMGGVPVPATYAEFLTAGTAISAANPDKSVFSLSTGVDYKGFGAMLYLSWTARNGGTILSSDMKTALLNGEKSKRTLGQWKQIIDNEWANPSLSNEGNFYLGKVAMLEMGCWSVPTVENAGLNVSIHPLFSLDAGSENNNSVLGLYSMCVTNQSDINKVKIAADFSAFISAYTQIQVDYAKASKCLPVTKEGVADEFFAADKWKPFCDALPGAIRRPGSPEWQFIETEIGNMYMKVVMEQSSIDDAAAYHQNRVQKRLDEYYGGL